MVRIFQVLREVPPVARVAGSQGGDGSLQDARRLHQPSHHGGHDAQTHHHQRQVSKRKNLA